MSLRVASILAVVVVLVVALGAAGPASAQPPPSTTEQGVDSPERGGPFIDAGMSFGAPGIVGADLQLGWMIDSWVGVFASLGGFLADESAAARVGLGVRLASGAVFAEAELASLKPDRECDLDEPCGDSDVHVAIVGVGVELLHRRHGGIDLHLQFITDGRTVVPLAGFGLGYYF